MVCCDESSLFPSFPSDLQRLAKPPQSALLWVGEGREELIDVNCICYMQACGYDVSNVDNV